MDKETATRDPSQAQHDETPNQQRAAFVPSIAIPVSRGTDKISFPPEDKMKSTGKLGHLFKLKDIGFVSFYVLFVTFCNFLVLPYRSDEVRFLATSLLTVSIYPLWKYNRKPDNGSVYIVIISVIYGLYFALPLLMPFDFYLPFRNVPNEARVQALQLSLIGLSAMLIAFYRYPKRLFESWCPRLPSARLDKSYTYKIVVCLGLVGLCSNILGLLVNIPLAAGQILFLPQQLVLLATSILFYNQLRYQLPRSYILFLWFIMIPVQAALDLSTGLLFSLIRDASVVLMTYMLVKRRIPWMAIGSSSIIFLLLLMSKGQFRKETWNSESDRSTSILSKVMIYGQLFLGSTSNYDSEVTTKGMEGIVTRLDFHSIFAHVVSMTPGNVPYWDGETYIPLLTRFIPRVIWPDKPMETTGQTFGHRYVILDNSDLFTSLNMPQIVELYANFGTLGVIFGMILIGFIYRLLYHVFEHPKSNEWNHLVGIVIFSSLLNIDSNFSLSFGNVIPSLVFYYFLGRVVFPNRVAEQRARLFPLNARS